MTQIPSGQSYYEEIKEIYKEMRRWRHDYHNHLQTMDALAQSKKYVELSEYIKMLSGSFTALEAYISSGNAVVDAVEWYGHRYSVRQFAW